ncbi:MAG TPA: type 1 glutamine amidotransferase [Casimicrobiaceae bacterium]|nr:type 1 glutamine amidotransferase [Casimicrobiaceae bacterium]
MKPVAIFRFSPTEGPGYFGEWLDANGVPRRLFALDRGELVPAESRAFAGIGMMGGPMSVNDDLTWSSVVLGFIRDAVSADVPVIGHCLGGQLLAKSLGASVVRTATPEIGWGDVDVPDAASNPWFGHRERFRTFQWHYDIFGLPRGAERVLTNAFNPEQAFALGKHVGFQCHIEMTREMVESWCASGGDELPPRSTGAMQSKAEILEDVDARLATLSRVADDVYAHWARGLVR